MNVESLSSNLIRTHKMSVFSLLQKSSLSNPKLRGVEEDWRCARELLGSIHANLNTLANEFNIHISDAALKVRLTTPELAREAPPTRSNKTKSTTTTYLRFLAYTPTWALSVRASQRSVEIFLLPTSDLVVFEQSETPSSLKLSLKLEPRNLWTVDNYAVTEIEQNTLVRSLFRDMIVRSKGDAEIPSNAMRLPLPPDGESLARSVRALMGDKQMLVQKIVTQQEDIQGRIGRDLHDAIISDIMCLKRSLSGDRRLSDAEMISILDGVTDQLYEICEALTPRNLKDWGLQTVLRNLLNGAAEQTGAHCVFECPTKLPELPEEVELHIYRIVQECLNNVRKYALAGNIKLSLLNDGATLTVKIQDDGKGFDRIDCSPRNTKGGRGRGIVRERTELINCYYPARLLVESEQLVGTIVTLEVHFSEK